MTLVLALLIAALDVIAALLFIALWRLARPLPRVPAQDTRAHTTIFRAGDRFIV